MDRVIPINVDVNASKRDYKDLLTGQLLIYSTFYTIQGEGPFAGTPALFVRLAGCNIGLKQDCPWCDTKFDLKSGRIVQAAQVVMVSLALHKPCDLIVLTGGEPLLQWDRIKEVIAEVAPHFGILTRPTWQFETNGLLLRDEHIEAARKLGRIKFVVSPKVPHGRLTYPEVPDCWKDAEVLDLKYVVSADPDSPYHDVPEDALRAGNDLYISGMTVYKRSPLPGEIASIWDDTLIDRQATAENYAHAAKLAKLYGKRLSFQTHLFGVTE